MDKKELERCVSELKTFSPLHKKYIFYALERIIEYYANSLLGLAIFGSYAREENRKNSDLDFLIILKEAKNLSKRMREFVENVELTLEPLGQELYEKDDIFCELSPYILEKKESLMFHPIYLDLAEHNKILFDREGIISRIIKSTKSLMKQHGAKKSELSNFWEWKVESGKFLGGIEL